MCVCVYVHACMCLYTCVFDERYGCDGSVVNIIKLFVVVAFITY